jgi:diphthine synthase
MLYLIGLGLYDEGDISVRGIETAKKCDTVCVELYTSPWQGSLKKLGGILGKEVVELNRPDLEENLKLTIEKAYSEDMALFVPGDPLVATTHSSVVMEAHLRGIKVEVIHASSVFSAVAETGLHIYKFGKTATVAYPEKNFFPKTAYYALKENKERGLHTLLLLDVKADKDKYMTINEAIELLLKLEEMENESVFDEKTLCVGVARLGGDDKKTLIGFGNAEELVKQDFGGSPHVLIVPGELHFSEEDYLKDLGLYNQVK